MDDQIYIFGKQFHKIWRLKDKVDVIITDSPLLLSIYYNKEKSDYFNDFIIEQYNRFNNKLFFIERNNDYQVEGRLQTIDEAKQIDKDVKAILERYDISYECVKNEKSVERIVDYILEELNEK